MRNSLGSPLRRLMWAPAALFALLFGCGAAAQMTNRPNGAVPATMTSQSKIAAYCQGAVLRGPSSLFFVSQIFYLNGALTYDHHLLEVKHGVSIIFIEKWSQFMHCPYPGANR